MPTAGSFVIDGMWVFVIFSLLAIAALVASQVVRKREERRRHAQAEALTRQWQRRKELDEQRAGPPDDNAEGDQPPTDVPWQRERREHRSRDT